MLNDRKRIWKCPPKFIWNQSCLLGKLPFQDSHRNSASLWQDQRIFLVHTIWRAYSHFRARADCFESQRGYSGSSITLWRGQQSFSSSKQIPTQYFPRLFSIVWTYSLKLRGAFAQGLQYQYAYPTKNSSRSWIQICFVWQSFWICITFSKTQSDLLRFQNFVYRSFGKIITFKNWNAPQGFFS